MELRLKAESVAFAAFRLKAVLHAVSFPTPLPPTIFRYNLTAETISVDSHFNNKFTHTTFDRIVPVRIYFDFRMNTRVLVLNASFEPINVCTVRRAVVLVLK